MKVPEPVRKIYNFFPLYTYSEPKQAPIEDTLYIYSFETIDPGCLLAKAILTQYKIPHRVEDASPYITPANKLPVFVKGKEILNLGQMIEKLVPAQDRQEPLMVEVLKRVENAYYTLLEQRKDIINYQRTRDQKRLWPLNLAINKQTADEASTNIGFTRTTTKELEIALEALNNLVVERHGSPNLVDLMLYAVLKPLDEIVELPRELQREMIRVADRLDFETGEQELIILSDQADPSGPDPDLVIV